MSSERLLISGGEIVDSTGRRRADVLVSEGLIEAVGTGLTDLPNQDSGKKSNDSQTQTLQVDGCIVSPGLVDLFACLGEPGNEQAETVATATAAAALGGYTAVLAQPNTEPPIDSELSLAEQRRLATQAHCTVIEAATISEARAGIRLSAIGELFRAGVRWFTDVSAPANERLLLQAMRYAQSLGATVALAPFTPTLCEGTVIAEGPVSARLGLRAEPAVSEEIAVDLAINLARVTGCHVHLDRISTAGAVDRIRYAKANDALSVSAAVTAQHLYFTDEDCAGFDSLLRAQPPYRTSKDRDALRAGVSDGTIDAIVSGHTPHRSEQVEVPYELAPPGVLALQTTAAVVIGSCDLPLEQAIAAMSWRPAALVDNTGRQGCVVEADAPANLTVIDPSSQWQPTVSDLASRSHNSPYLGHTLTSRVRHTVHEGRLTVCDGALTAPVETGLTSFAKKTITNA